MPASTQEESIDRTRYRLRDVPPARPVPTVADDVREGFAVRPRRLPPKYFYDDHGSRLFDRICDTPEYYPTRTEARLLAESAGAIVREVRPAHIVELGSGTSRKTEALLAACEAEGLTPHYWPFDVCASIMESAAARLLPRFPWLGIDVLVGDYGAGLDHLPRPEGGCLYLFLGGTLGNFEPEASVALLGELRAGMRPGDRLLLGVDRVKPTPVLEAAYNDAEGLTAAFNRNVLTVLNRELQADFDPAAFDHRAFFDEALSRIEMHLVARSDQHVRVAALGTDYRFAAGESLRTEISRKFTPESLRAELQAAGLALTAHHEPRDGAFSLALAGPAAGL